MSFQDVGVRGGSGLPAASTRRARGIPSAASLAAKQKERNEKELSGLLYGKLKLVPSYETAESEQMGSLEFSSCSESTAESSPLPNLTPSAKKVTRNSNNPSNTSKGSPSRGIAGFSTQRRSKKNRLPGRAPLQPREWAEVDHYQYQSNSNYRDDSLLPQEDDLLVTRGISVSPNRGVTASASSMHKENSKYSELNTEIKHFAKMVAQLEVLLQQSAESPEVQWRARILSRSAQEADRDIADKLYWYEKSLVDRGKQKEARTVQAACMKLHNGFHRVHTTLEEALYEGERRQRSDASLLGGAISYPESNSMLLQQEQEDFFERATREREEEIRIINDKMHKVNLIYNELAQLVDSQQEQIDVVQENVTNAKDTVEGGLRHIEYARDRLCAMGGDGDGFEPPTCGGGDEVADDDYNGTSSSTRRSNGGTNNREQTDYYRLYPSSVGESEIFHWSMPFQTFHKDIKAVQKDILGLGSDIASFRLPEKMVECGSLADIHCGKTKDSSSVVGSNIFDDADDDDSL